MALAKQERVDAQKSLVGFVVGEIAYAVPIAHVREIVNPIPLSQLPHAPAAVAGVADHRGEVVPIIDLRVRFGLPPTRDARKCKWILIEVEGRGVGLVVDRVTEVFGKVSADIRAAPTLGTGDEERGISGVTTHEGVLIFVLDTAEFEILTRPVPAQLLAGSLRAPP
jgi:purine-binding chemotaxis protein CheW